MTEEEITQLALQTNLLVDAGRYISGPPLDTVKAFALLVRQQDEPLLRQALEKLEMLIVLVDSEWGDCRGIAEIEAEGELWPEIIALRERLTCTKC